MTGLPALAAVAIAILLIIGALNVIKETVWTVLVIVGILALLYFVFGVTPQLVWLAAQELLTSITGFFSR